MTLDQLELWIGRIAGGAALATLAIALVAMYNSLRRPAGREEPGARILLRGGILGLATILFLALGVILWRPLPFDLSDSVRLALLSLGSALLFGALGLYLWGLVSLGRMFAPSSGFGVRLSQAPGLVTRGPYTFMRHPMYLAVIVAGIACLMLYRTWATLAFAGLMFGLIVRARREERVLAEEFGSEWASYAAEVPGWLPRRRRDDPAA